MCDLERLSELDRLILADLVDADITRKATPAPDAEVQNLMRIWHILTPADHKPAI